MKIIVSAGGTGGHIYPALAIIKKFQERESNLEVLYIGTHNRMEKDIVPKMNIRYEALEIYGFSKTNIAKTFIHEQNSIPGKSNIHLSKLVDLVGISFKNSESYFKNAKKVVYTGNPCGENALAIKKTSKVTLGFKPTDKLIIIVAGSLGSETLNNKFKSFLCSIDNESYKVLYITGNNYYEEFMRDANFSKNVKVVPYYDNLASIMKDAYLIISRAGASTISEILSLKVPSILIPSPYVANNHQYYNALDLVNLKVAELIEEKNLNDNIIKVMVNELVYNDKLYNEFKNNLEALNTKESSSIIYDEIKELIKWNMKKMLI